MGRIRSKLMVFVALGSLACSGRTTPADGDSASETSTGDGDTGDGDGDGDGDTGDGDGDTGDGDGDTGDGDTGDGDGDTGDGDGDGDPVCPEPIEALARFVVTPPTPRTGLCTVVDETNVITYLLTLDCEGEVVTIGLDTTLSHLPRPGAAGSMLTLDYRVAPGGQLPDRWLALHRADNPAVLVLGAVAATSLDPPGTTLADFWGVLSLAVGETQPCLVIPDDCGENQRLALEVWTSMFGPSNTPVFDHGSWFADFLAFGFTIEVEEATRRTLPVTCDDVPEGWFQAVAVWFPSD